MATEGNDRPTEPPSGRHVRTLRITRKEAREVLDTQLATITDIDEKAMRTVRIALLLVGIALSASAFPNAVMLVNWVTISAVFSLVLSILCGIVTYGASNPAVGVSRRYLTEAREVPYTEAEWLTLVIAGYDEWIADAEQLTTSNVRTLTASQLFLGCGLVLLTTGVLLGLLGHLDPVISFEG